VYAWAAIGVSVAFIGLTCWWLTQDRSIPIYDAGDHLETAFLFHDMIRAGNLLGPFNYESPYPPLALLVGAISAFVGGVNVAAPIIGENLLFVSLLALGCYRAGRLLFGSLAGLLAVACALGSALLIAQFHVFMLDAPEASLVAVSIWLLLACEDFSRVRFAALAGLAVGVGMLVKAQYPSFVMGIGFMALLRGGWRNWRGLVAFAIPALVLACPWYIHHIGELSTFARNAGSNPATTPNNAPPTFSPANFTWYFWNILNSQLFVPLFLLLVGGTAWLSVNLLRQRREAWSGGFDRASARLEFFCGAFIAWLFITLTRDHDIRYGIPLMPYLAIIATGWIVCLPRVARLAGIGVLVLGVSANTLSTTFGVKGEVQVQLVRSPPVAESLPDRIRFYSSEGFLVSGPRRDGDVPGLLEALYRDGVRVLSWGLVQSRLADFSFEGLVPLARIAHLQAALTQSPQFSKSARVATLLHEPVAKGSPPTCTRMSDGTGVWVVRYDTAAHELALYCPTGQPRFYDAGILGSR
jgi:4-amino-4-deoxy-L-arabinose transferase-like glycosyltransferase